MAYFYVDTDGIGATAPYDTWAKAGQDLITVMAAMSAGDICFVQGLTTDTAAATRTIASSGLEQNPCKIIGVADGTTNTGTSVVAADLAVTLIKIECTGAGNDLTFSGSSLYSGIHFTAVDRFNTDPAKNTWENCKLTLGGRINSNASTLEIINSELEFTGTLCGFFGGYASMRGGVVTFTAASSLAYSTSAGEIEFIGVDLSGLTASIISSTGGSGAIVQVQNCKMPATFSLFGSISTGTNANSKATVVASDNSSSVGATSSIQDYLYQDMFGSIDLETTIVRTGGADDEASGGFAYAMITGINSTLEGSNATLKSPWMNVWLAGGANTLKVHIANEIGVDLNEDEFWIEAYTPNSNDTAQHEQNFDPANERLLDSSTAITDDTVSEWSGDANGTWNEQELEVTVTTGFEGWAYIRGHYAKRFASDAKAVYLCPKIVVT